MSETKQISIGDVIIHRGVPLDGNPYKVAGLCGNERKEALQAFKQGKPPADLTFWYAPAGGGARRLFSAENVHWV